MSLYRNNLGYWGEQVARDFLIGKKYDFVASNLRFGHGEIDLLMRDGSGLIFVEVKTKSSLSMGEPAEEVDTKKMNKVCETIECILACKEYCLGLGIGQNDFWRLDIVAIYGDGKTVSDIIHYENITFWCN